eukprot:scaffold63598_cov54-Phaeocystis_antarctica.AAC.3
MSIYTACTEGEDQRPQLTHRSTRINRIYNCCGAFGGPSLELALPPAWRSRPPTIPHPAPSGLTQPPLPYPNIAAAGRRQRLGAYTRRGVLRVREPGAHSAKRGRPPPCQRARRYAPGAHAAAA